MTDLFWFFVGVGIFVLCLGGAKALMTEDCVCPTGSASWEVDSDYIMIKSAEGVCYLFLNDTDAYHLSNQTFVDASYVAFGGDDDES